MDISIPYFSNKNSYFSNLSIKRLFDDTKGLILSDLSLQSLYCQGFITFNLYRSLAKARNDWTLWRLTVPPLMPNPAF